MRTITSLLVILLLLCTQTQAQYITNAETTTELKDLLDKGEMADVRYFYYPNLQAYFDRQTATYIYTRNGKEWLESDSLPNGLRGYSSANGTRVAIPDYDGDTPYERLEEHTKKYPANYSTKRQVPNSEIKETANNLASK